jgi:putative transposase
MIDRWHDLPITKQARMLNVSRGSVHYLPRPASTADLALMRRMDEPHLDFPFAGSRMPRDPLTAEGFQTGRRPVATLMKRMRIQAVYRKPNTSKPAPGRAMRRSRVPTKSGPWGLQALFWRLSITMEAGFCVEAVAEALARHGKPDIFNTDQGSQFTSTVFTGPLTDNAIAMDGRGAWRDNVFVERLWRSVIYTEVYPRNYDYGSRGAEIARQLLRLLQLPHASFQP